MTIWLQKTRKQQKLDLIRIKNHINNTSDNFITDSGYGHPHYNTVSEVFDDIYFLSKRNKRNFYNTTITSAIAEVSNIIFQKCWTDAHNTYNIDSSEFKVYIDPTSNLRTTQITDNGISKLELLCKRKNELIKSSLKDYTIDINNTFMYDYSFGIGLNFILPIKTTLNNDIVNEHIENFWKYGETHKLQKVTIYKDELDEYLRKMLYITD